MYEAVFTYSKKKQGTWHNATSVLPNSNPIYYIREGVKQGIQSLFTRNLIILIPWNFWNDASSFSDRKKFSYSSSYYDWNGVINLVLHAACKCFIIDRLVKSNSDTSISAVNNTKFSSASG